MGIDSQDIYPRPQRLLTRSLQAHMKSQIPMSTAGAYEWIASHIHRHKSLRIHSYDLHMTFTWIRSHIHRHSACEWIESHIHRHIVAHSFIATHMTATHMKSHIHRHSSLRSHSSHFIWPSYESSDGCRSNIHITLARLLQAHMHESSHTFPWVMSHTWMSLVTHVNADDQVVYVNELHMNEYEWIKSHIPVSQQSRDRCRRNDLWYDSFSDCWSWGLCGWFKGQRTDLSYGVAMVSRIDKITGLSCRI